MLRSLRVALLGLSVFVLAGCRRDGGEPRVAFVSNNNYEFWTFAQKGAEAAAKEQGVIVEFKMPPNGKAEEQQKFIDDLVVKGVKGIAISPNDAKNMSDYLTRIGKQVPLLTVDNDIPDASGRRAYLGTHNYRAGRAAGELVAKAVPDGGKVVIFVGSMDATNAVERRQGVLDALAGIDQKEIGKITPADARNLKVGKFTLVDTRTDSAKATVCQQQCEDALTKYPDIAAVVGLWAYNPPALLRAVEKSEKKPAIIGFDEDDDTLVGIQEGKVFGTIVQDPYRFGKDSVTILAGIARGDKDVFKKYPQMEAENRIYIPFRIVDKGNVDAFRAEVKAILGK